MGGSARGVVELLCFFCFFWGGNLEVEVLMTVMILPYDYCYEYFFSRLLSPKNFTYIQNDAGNIPKIPRPIILG